MILEHIKDPKQIKKYTVTELDQLAGEIRERLVQVVSKQGGHLGASLGAVEIAIALHYVFDSPKDKIIWDVGHQAYAHKILTGRNIAFDTMRGENGLSGFPKRHESKHDIFGVGHASTSISAALGVNVGSHLQGKDEKVVAVIGDGSMTGGLAYEGLNNLRSNIAASKNMIIILNDNGMSISPNVGGLSSYLSRKLSSRFFTKIRGEIKHSLSNRLFLKILIKIKKLLKSILMPGEFFESLGLRYFGPIDGHNLKELVEVFSNIRESEQDMPVLIHVRTQKGKGYKYAESAPVKYHGVSKFDSELGVQSKKKNGWTTYTEVFGDALCDVADKNEKVCAITAAMTTGTGLVKFSERFPDRFYDVGIAEAHAVTFAAGLATENLVPVVAIYSTFLQRSFDQIIHDVCLQNLPVIFCLDRAGFVGEDGPTHHGCFDLSYLRMVPNLVVMAPSNGRELRNMVFSATRYKCPVAIRYPRASVATPNRTKLNFIPIGEVNSVFKSDIVASSTKVLLLCCGPFADVCADVAKALTAEGLSSEALDVRFIKPLPQSIFNSIRNADVVFTVEENAVAGGFGSALLEHLSFYDKVSLQKVNLIGIEDKFAEHASREILLKKHNLDRESIFKKVLGHVVHILSGKKAFKHMGKNINKYTEEIITTYEERAH